MGLIFRPAAILMGRLRYPVKIAVVNLVLLIPLTYVAYAYVDIQRSQVAFSAKERDGVAYLRPLLDLTARTVEARHLSVTGAPAGGAGVDAALQPVDDVDRRLGAGLEVSDKWREARSALTAAAGARGPDAAYSAYNTATDALLGLIVLVSDKSNLTLDPDLDSYYVMDAVVFRLPLLLDTVGRAVDRSLLARDGDAAERDAARIELAISTGALSTTQAAVDAGMATAFKATGRDELRDRGKAPVATARDRVDAIQAQITGAVNHGDLTAVAASSGQAARAAVAELATIMAPQLDALLQTRIGGFNANEFQVITIAAVAFLLVAYLVVGFYLSATPPLRRTVATLRALADGDLTQTVAVTSRDEIGEMGQALNTAMGKLRDVVRSIDSSASGVADYSAQLSDVSGRLRLTADGASQQAGAVSGAASQVSENVHAVALSTGEMTSAIGEIAGGANEAAAVASEAVRVAQTADQAIRALGASSAEIGDVVKTITTIAEQTNLLALNATIEAARAGEAGRGFGVVASEVKDLAQGTSRATDQITARIGAIQADTRAAVQAIEEISAVIGRINAIQASIAAAVEEQTATTNEMSRNISEVTGSSRDISSGIAAVAQAAEDTTRDAGNTEQAARELAETAAGMREVVARFRAQ